ncbi:MAG: leucine-rich repeat domain-containing protein [Bacteroidaceae bacterium]
MKKTFRFAGVVAMSTILAISATSCSQGGGKETNGEAKENVKAKEAEKVDVKDIFFYTPRHRAEKYQPTEEKLGFGKDILYIADSEFEGNTNIKEIWFAPKLNHILNKAFRNCTSLRQVHFQGPIAVINDNAFEGCKSLETLNVDAYTVGVEAFKGCTSLSSVRFGDNIWWIRVGAFEGCTNLKSILMAITMKKLDDGAFVGCNALEEVSIPNDFKNRMFGMLETCTKLKKVYLLSTEYYEMPKNCNPSASCTLYVPDAFLAKFKADPEWSKFGSIEPLSKSAHYTGEGFWKKK